MVLPMESDGHAEESLHDELGIGVDSNMQRECCVTCPIPNFSGLSRDTLAPRQTKPPMHVPAASCPT